MTSRSHARHDHKSGDPGTTLTLRSEASRKVGQSHFHMAMDSCPPRPRTFSTARPHDSRSPRVQAACAPTSPPNDCPV
jgi:hypothetical protein